MVHFLQCSGTTHMPLPLFFVFLSLLLFASMEVAHSDAGRLPLRSLEIGTSKEEEASAGEGEMLKMQRRSLIGSRPPRCERVCMSCGHCEAVQVPIVPQHRKKKAGQEQPVVSAIGAAMLTTYRVNGGVSDYKPLSWKCRCGGIILDP